MKKVTVLGGGTGTYVVLTGLKQFRDLDLASIVTMMDSGGSTGRLRDQLGVLPPGDLRQSLVALSDAPMLWRKLFLYRFENGDLEGHNFGNIFLSALSKVSDDYQEVIETAQYVLKTRGNVIPVTLESTHLCVEYENGKVLKSEGLIDEDNNETSKVKQAFLDPVAQANPLAVARILESDAIVIGPGDLYSSIVSVLLVDGISKAIQQSNAKIIYITNLMTKMGQTSQYTAKDHVNEIKKYTGKHVDTIITNNGVIDEEIKDWYAKSDEREVDMNLNGSDGSDVIAEDIIDRTVYEKNGSDKLTRSILRHDSHKLAQIIHKTLI